MREALLKKRFGVPALLLIAMLLTAGSVTAFLVTSINCTTATTEPLTFTKTDPLDIAYQGESDTITVRATNASTETGYGIFADYTIENINRIESLGYSRTNRVAYELKQKTDFNGDNDTIDAKYNIDADESFRISLTVNTADNAEPGDVVVTMDFHREYTYE